jgi:protein TonB
MSVAVHLGVVALLWSWPSSPLPSIVPAPALKTFDVVPPPEPPSPILPPDPMRVPPNPATIRNDDPGGASAGRFSPHDTRIAAVPRPEPAVPAPPAWIDEAMTRAAPITADGLDVALTPPADAISGLGRAALGAGIGSTAGKGAGSGQGDGMGAGRGRGRLARARWVRMPTREEMKPFWPPAAVAAKLSGKAILECVVPRIGPPTSCRALAETPVGSGFGQAAVTMSPIFRIVPVTRERRVEDMPIIVPVSFTYTGR